MSFDTDYKSDATAPYTIDETNNSRAEYGNQHNVDFLFSGIYLKRMDMNKQSSIEALQEAITLLGGQRKLAVALGFPEVSGGSRVNGWLKRGVPSDQAIPIEKVTGGKVHRSRLAPALYPPEEAEA